MAFRPTEVESLARCISLECDQRSRWLRFTWNMGTLDGPTVDLDQDLDGVAECFVDNVVAELKEQRGRFGFELPWESPEL